MFCEGSSSSPSSSSSSSFSSCSFVCLEVSKMTEELLHPSGHGALRIRTKHQSSSHGSSPIAQEQQSSPSHGHEEEAQQEPPEREPCTPAGRLFMRHELYLVVLCAIRFQNPVDVQAFKIELENTFLKHKRFSSILVKDKNGFEHWERVKLNINDHIVIPCFPTSQIENNNLVEEYISRIAMSPPLDVSRPLWEIHIINMKSKGAAACCLFRIHHSLGDGTSLMSLLIACTRRVDMPELLPTIPSTRTPSTHYRINRADVKIDVLRNLLAGFYRFFIVIWCTFTGIYQFLKNLLIDDSELPIRGPPGVESMRKAFAVATLELDDLQLVKKTTGGTVNDVLMGIISSGLRHYLLHHSDTCSSNAHPSYIQCPENQMRSSNSQPPSEERHELGNLKITALAMMNIRPSPGLQELADMMKWGTKARWGNQMGYLLIPVSLGSCRDVLDHVHRAKAVNDCKKASYEALFSYKSGAVIMNAFGPEAAMKLTYRSVVHTTCSISNVVGPVEEIMFAGNPITEIVVTSYGVPQALTIHMLSYMRKVRFGIMVSQHHIPDPQVLSQCFVDALKEMKQVALQTPKNI